MREYKRGAALLHSLDYHADEKLDNRHAMKKKTEKDEEYGEDSLNRNETFFDNMNKTLDTMIKKRYREEIE